MTMWETRPHLRGDTFTRDGQEEEAERGDDREHEETAQTQKEQETPETKDYDQVDLNEAANNKSYIRGELARWVGE